MSKRLLIIDENRELIQAIEDRFIEWGIEEYTIDHQKDIQSGSVDGYNCIIVGNKTRLSREKITALNTSGQEVIILVDSLNHKYIGEAVMGEIIFHYAYSPVDSLCMKVLGYNPRLSTVAKKNQQKDVGEEGRIISYMSPAGGSGKSTLAINCGIHIAKKGKKVLLMDFSTFSSMPVNLKVKVSNKGLDSVVSEMELRGDGIKRNEVKELLVSAIQKYKIGGYALDFIHINSPLKSERIDGKKVELILAGAKMLGYDVILMDTSDELNEKNIAIAELSDKIFLCGNVDVGSGWKFIKFNELMDHIQLAHKCRLLINKYNAKCAFSCTQLAAELNMKWLRVIPFSRNISYHSNKGIPIACVKNPMNRIIKEICNEIIPLFGKREIKIWKRYS